jgi:hypothetical protein
MCALVFALAIPAVAAADERPEAPPAISLRPFVMGAEQAFAAVNTFEAVFGQSRQPFFGGGLEVVLGGRFYVDATASRFRKTGERAYRYNGQNFPLGLPLTAEITPFEITGGYRFRLRRMPAIVPYAGAGFGSYAYKETSPSSDPDENVNVRHGGAVAAGGVEIRVQRWIGIGVDAQYTHVPGVLGTGGLSKDAGERDLGGVAARLKVVVGR